MSYLLLLSGFVLLLVSGDLLVKGSVSLARHIRVSTLVVGIVVVSFGTSAPELVVSLKAAIGGHPDIAVGNVIGSNISNIALVLAITAIILPIPIRANTIKTDWPVMMLSGILFYIFSLNGFIGFWEGFCFFLFLAGYVIFSVIKSRKNIALLNDKVLEPKFSLVVSVLIIIASSAGLVYGANWLIDGVTVIARKYGVSERVISISVIAFGTSLPELATSAIAAFQKELDISIGNIIGSNIFNVFAVIGISSMVTDISINPNIIMFDIFWMLGIFVLLLLFILPLKGGVLNRLNGIFFLFVYFVYVFLLFYL